MILLAPYRMARLARRQPVRPKVTWYSNVPSKPVAPPARIHPPRQPSSAHVTTLERARD
ncbi:MAG TPA: hypothetical protein VGD45_25395 [Steroidobacter sp.]